jgi:NAD(P)-dependent dehydrogenase (short-subunit alcohol dehydrogenase family)
MTRGNQRRVAIVTGGGNGIGAGIANHLADRGLFVIVNDLGASLDGVTVSGDGASAVVADLRSRGGAGVADGTDVSDFEAVQDLVARTVAEHGDLSIVVNSAGILRDRMIYNMKEDEWDAVIRVHLKGHFNTAHAAARHWRAQQTVHEAHRRLINITSRAGLYGSPGQPNYSAAKSGIIGLTYACANSLTKYGVTCNAVAPAASTRMTEVYPGWPQERIGSKEWAPESVAPIVGWLASDRSSWCNGRVLGSQGYEVSLYALPEVVRSVRASDGWSIDELDDQMDEVFRPFVEADTGNIFAGAATPVAKAIHEKKAGS